jgi:hypothetical protein
MIIRQNMQLDFMFCRMTLFPSVPATSSALHDAGGRAGSAPARIGTTALVAPPVVCPGSRFLGTVPTAACPRSDNEATHQDQRALIGRSGSLITYAPASRLTSAHRPDARSSRRLRTARCEAAGRLWPRSTSRGGRPRPGTPRAGASTPRRSPAQSHGMSTGSTRAPIERASSVSDGRPTRRSARSGT